MIVVSDNSPLQYLILIDCIHVLPTIYGQVLTTPQVLKELSHPETPEIVRNWSASPPSWLGIENPKKMDFLDRLHVGEASAISLAQERHADLVLIDERAGTDAARKVEIQPIGTLGVLIEAGVDHLIDFEPALNRLTATTSFYASVALIEAARKLFYKRNQMGKP